MLLASAAASPAIAAPHNWAGGQQAQDDRQSAREERQSTREERQSSKEDRSQSREGSRGDRSDRSSDARQYQQVQQQQVQQQQVQQVQQHQLQSQQHQQGFSGRGAERYYARPDRSNQGGRNEGNVGSAYVAPGPRVVTPGSNFQQRQEDRQAARELRQSNRPTPNVMRDRHPLVVSDTPRPGTQPPLRTEVRRTPTVHWNNNWRNDHRYDWHHYRNHHRSHFHLGFYFDPYGWGYQPFSIGWRLWPSYYSSNYWINDPWSYRLPYPPPGTIWVRYWNDALLVDTWTGTVIDVIPGFFW